MRRASNLFQFLAGAAFLLCLGFAGSASAVSIDFSEFPIGTVITNQYAGSGVTFAAVSGTAPMIVIDGANPTSPVLSPAGGPGAFQGDFNILLSPGFDFVSFDSGFWNEIGTAVIEVYGPGDTLIATITNTLLGIENIVISGLGQIERIYFDSAADPFGGAIDNFVATPEPTTATMLALGLIGFGVARRRSAARAS